MNMNLPGTVTLTQMGEGDTASDVDEPSSEISVEHEEGTDGTELGYVEIEPGIMDDETDSKGPSCTKHRSPCNHSQNIAKKLPIEKLTRVHVFATPSPFSVDYFFADFMLYDFLRDEGSHSILNSTIYPKLNLERRKS